MNAADSISHSFCARKQKILDDLSVPDEKYTDLSPKGSVDVNIRPLIREINELPGLVTTSSCAGRVSVFLEGEQVAHGNDPQEEGYRSKERSLDDGRGSNKVEESQPERQGQFAPTGGKGSGKWLFVSHDPVLLGNKEQASNECVRSLHKLFGLKPGDGKLDADSTAQIRLVRFHFEPMILHIMSSSLHHAQPILAAASSAGFRESGLQSLRCLVDSSSHPIVAVRSSGLALESVIGYYSQSEGCAKSLVTEEYLQMLVSLANERFKINSERIERFRRKFMELYHRSLRGSSSRRDGWEDPDVRRERKRAEGLRKKVEAARKYSHKQDEDLEEDLEFSLFEQSS
ncbi:hypothetical protein VTO42DRAFT_7381 [Malbranchea cinnamomea]